MVDNIYFFFVADVFDLLDKLFTLTIVNIPSILLRRPAAPLTLPFILFNKTLKIDKVPLEWKNDYIIPVHKNVSKAVISKSRPISLTCILCRVLERLIRKEINDNCDKSFFFSIVLY